MTDVGIEIGIEKGKLEGKREGEIKIIYDLLEIKFADNAFLYHERLQKLSLDQLESIPRRIFSCDDIDLVFEGIFPVSF